MRKLGIILVGILGLILLIGCEKKELPKFLVPSDADLIAEVQAGKLLADVDWEQVYAAIPGDEKPPTISAALDELFNQTGIDARTFTSVTVFLRIPEGTQGGGIVLGTFDESKFIRNLEEKTGEKFSTQSYEGYTVYFPSEEKSPLGFAFIGRDMLIGGNGPAVKDALSVAAGKKAALSGTLKETHDGLGTPLVKLVMSIPESLKQMMLQGMAGGDMPFDLSSVVGVQMVALSFDKVGPELSLLVKGLYDTAEAAQRAQSVIEGARLLFSGMLPDPALRSFLNKVQVSKQEAWVNLSLKATVDEVKGLGQAISKLGPQATPTPAGTPANASAMMGKVGG